MKVPVLLSMLGLFVLLGATNSDAAAMYCGNELVTEGMTKLEVVSKCAPDFKEVTSVNTLGGAARGAFRATTSAVEVWQYNCGTGRFNKTLYFDADRLAKIDNSKTYGTGAEKCA
ncbi:MAG: DUF2845 domain-containing protein [Candidatus Binatia bacterium]